MVKLQFNDSCGFMYRLRHRFSPVMFREYKRELLMGLARRLIVMGSRFADDNPERYLICVADRRIQELKTENARLSRELTGNKMRLFKVLYDA